MISIELLAQRVVELHEEIRRRDESIDVICQLIALGAQPPLLPMIFEVYAGTIRASRE